MDEASQNPSVPRSRLAGGLEKEGKETFTNWTLTTRAGVGRVSNLYMGREKSAR